MSLITKVKVSGIDNLTEARFYAGAQVEWLGFNFSPGHVKYLEPETAEEILGWVQGPVTCGDFEGQRLQIMKQVQEQLELDYIQLPVHQIQEGLEFPLIGEVVIDPTGDVSQVREWLERYHEQLDYFQFNFRRHQFTSDEMEELGWTNEELAGLAEEYPLLLDQRWTVSRALEVVEEIDPAGINIRAAGEAETGLKSFDEVADFIEALEAEA